MTEIWDLWDISSFNRDVEIWKIKRKRERETHKIWERETKLTIKREIRMQGKEFKKAWNWKKESKKNIKK